MKQVLILCRHDERADYDQIDTYKAAMSVIDSKNQYTYGELEDVLFEYDGESFKVTLNGRDIQDYDGLFLIGWFKTKMLEDVALSVSTYMYHYGVKVFNTEALYTRSRSKLSQYAIAALNKIPTTPFLFSMNPVIMKQHLEKWGHGFPVIMKAVTASRGNDNYLVHDLEESFSIVDKTDADDGPWFVVQGFVPNSGDLRVIVMGDEVKYVIHRRSLNGGHLNNTSKGGEATEIEPNDLPKKVLADVVSLARLLRREITGVDLIQHKETNEYYLLEINNMPQMATGSFVQEKMKALDSFFINEL